MVVGLVAAACSAVALTPEDQAEAEIAHGVQSIGYVLENHHAEGSAIALARAVNSYTRGPIVYSAAGNTYKGDGAVLVIRLQATIPGSEFDPAGATATQCYQYTISSWNINYSVKPVSCPNHQPSVKGLLITTGSFTREAQLEATREGAPPVELIAGDQLCNLLKVHSLGVEVTVRTQEDVEIDAGFFNDYE